ncbi:uncharacterized protein FMAN_15517 [Fusarium mangiferae]|nr:uncharacterized protein FMAN_15517 [Fusarium mangiferae]CVL09359.1 uncharacterized protein FMAN_15517 [Fusarium mangiferae]
MIPASMRPEKKAAMGRIRYNTDKGYFLVSEPWRFGLHRTYMFSGSRYATYKKAFTDNQGKTLIADDDTGENDEPLKIWKIVIEDIAVLKKAGRIYRVLVTWRDNEDPNRELPKLSNITSMRQRFGQATNQRLAFEQKIRGLEPDWALPKAIEDHEDAKALFVREHTPALIRAGSCLP